MIELMAYISNITIQIIDRIGKCISMHAGQGRLEKLMFCLFILVTSTVYGQKVRPVVVNMDRSITVNVSRLDTRRALGYIQNRRNIILSFNSQRIDMDELVTFDRRLYSLDEYLERVLLKQPLVVNRQISGKVVLEYDEVKAQRIKDGFLYPYQGYVYGSFSNEPLIGANIRFANGTKYTSTNELGYYFFLSAEPVDSVQFSYLGFDPQKIALTSSYQIKQKVVLVPNLTLDEVVILDKYQDEILQNTSKNSSYGSADFRNSSGKMGESDPFEILLTQGSIQSGNEGENNILVRGGSSDQNLLMMDGVPIYESGHMFGLSSIYNPQAIEKLEYYHAFFPAKFGGRLSSVVNFHLKDGNRNRSTYNIGLSPLSLKLHADGPIGSNSWTYSISLRQSLIDYTVRPVIKTFIEFDQAKFDFHDINLKLTKHFNNGSKLSLISFEGEDDFKLERIEDTTNSEGGEIGLTVENRDYLRWRTRLVGLKYAKIFGNQTAVNFLAYFSKYGLSYKSYFGFTYSDPITTPNSQFEVVSNSNIRDSGFKIFMDWYGNEVSQISGGVDAIFHNFQPSIKQYRGTSSENILEDIPNQYGNEIALYSEAHFALLPSTLTTIGFRLNNYFTDGKSFHYLEPRFSFSFKPGENQRLVFSYSRMSQFIHLLLNNGIGLPSDLWVPSTRDFKPELADHFTINYLVKFTEGLDISLGAYIKNLSGVLEYKSPFDLYATFINDTNTESKFLNHNDWERFVSSGNSHISGIEFGLHKRLERFDVQFNYTLMKASKQFDDLNDGLSFPSNLDRRHDLLLKLGYKVKKNIHLGLRWNYGTGRAFSLADQQYIDLSGNTFLYSESRNNFRMPDYHRLDFNLDYSKVIGSRGLLEIGFGVSNVYNRINPFYVYLYEDKSNDSFQLRQVSLYPILPTFSISYSF